MSSEPPLHAAIISNSNNSSRNELAPVLVQVSTPLLLLCMTPLLVVIYISARMDLGLERPMMMGTVRTFVQLSVLGMILEPIFVRGETCGWLVLGYTCLMVLLAAYEGMHRSQYQFPGMFGAVLASLGFNVAWVSLFAFGVVLQPDPLWDPQYVIPIVGMLLGNCINGIALALNSMLTALVEQAREIELHLSFGATPREASRRLIHEAVRVGALPQLNSMAIIGIINIPGMMTGQILGGTSVIQAARYQMLIMYLIAMCAFGTILTEVTMAKRAAFDAAYRLRTDFFIDTKRQKTAIQKKQGKGMMSWCSFQYWLGTHGQIKQQPPADHTMNNSYDTETTGLVAVVDDAEPIKNNIEIRKVELLNNANIHCRLEISNVTHSFVVPPESDNQRTDEARTAQLPVASSSSYPPHRRRRILFENLSLEIKAGEIAFVAGQSGVGKSTFLRLVAGLEPLMAGTSSRHHPPGSIQLHVMNNDNIDSHCNGASTTDTTTTTYDSQLSKTLWRRQVRYVTQTKVDMPGTPHEFIQRITSFHVTKKTELPASVNPASASALATEVRDLVRAWGMESSCLETGWSTLSGGEAQRVLVAIAMASRPRVLLLDESTSALDVDSKLLVEQSVLHYCRTYGMSVLWITHDRDQMERLASQATSSS